MTSISGTTSATTSGTTSASTSASTAASAAATAAAAVKSYASTNANTVDWTGLIDASYQAKLSGEAVYKTDISNNEAKISAYTTAQGLLQTLQSAANALRAPTDSLNQSDDVFQGRTATLTAVGGIDAASTVSVTSDSDADTGTHSLTISQLAQAEKIGSSTYQSSSTDLSLSGTVTLGTTGGKTANINITSSMSLTDIAGAINDQTSTTGIQASILKVSDTSYQLVVQTKDTGQTISLTDASGVFKSLGLTKSDGSYADELQKSQDATFAIDGVSLTRSTNDVSDALTGSTLHLYATTASGTSVTVEIGQDESKISTAINTFVTAYNAYRDWALTQQSTNSDGTASADSPLFSDSTIRQINTDVANGLNFSTSSTSLSALGITFDSNNKLTVDSTTLDNALASDPDQVQNLFAYTFGSTSSDLKLLDRGTGAPGSFTLDVSVGSDGSLSGVSVNGNSSLFTVSGSTITGVAGSAYDGYTFVYTGSTSQTITVNQSAGVAEQLYNTSTAAADSSTGSLQQLTTDLTTEDSNYNDQITNIETRAQTYKDNLTTNYAKIQASISTAQSNLSYLTALVDQKSSS